MAKKAKAKKPPAKLRGGALVREMFTPPGASFTIDEIAAKLGCGGLTPRASASAVLSVLANPAKTEHPIRISRNRETNKYELQSGWAPGPGTPPKAKPEAKAAPKKTSQKKAAKAKPAKAEPAQASV